jgi:predicted nucleic acid-binding protein
MAQQVDEDLFMLSNGRRDPVRAIGDPPEDLQALFAGCVLPFDENAGIVWAQLIAGGTARGQPRSPLDMIVAAIAEANDCVVVTDNEKDFAGVKIVNPLRAAN